MREITIHNISEPNVLFRNPTRKPPCVLDSQLGMAVRFRASTPNLRKAIRERRSCVSLALSRSSQTFFSVSIPKPDHLSLMSLHLASTLSMAVERVWLHGSATIDPNGAGANQSTYVNSLLWRSPSPNWNPAPLTAPNTSPVVQLSKSRYY